VLAGGTGPPVTPARLNVASFPGRSRGTRIGTRRALTVSRPRRILIDVPAGFNSLNNKNTEGGGKRERI